MYRYLRTNLNKNSRNVAANFLFLPILHSVLKALTNFGIWHNKVYCAIFNFSTSSQIFNILAYIESRELKPGSVVVATLSLVGPHITSRSIYQLGLLPVRVARTFSNPCLLIVFHRRCARVLPMHRRCL